MSTLTLLPLVRVADGVQPNEDWQLSIAFYLDDGVTPIDISSLTFTIQVGAFASLTSAGGQIAAAGPSNNVLVITALAPQTSTWPVGVSALSLAASDGVYTRDIFALSTLSVGSPQVARVSLLVAPDSATRSVAASVPAALAAAFQALQPAALAAALAALGDDELLNLTQAIFASLPVQTGSSAPVNVGQAFINSSGFVVIAQ